MGQPFFCGNDDSCGQAQAIKKRGAAIGMGTMARARLRQTGSAVLVAALALGALDAPAFAQADLSARIAAESERRLRAEDEAARVRQTGPGVVTDPLSRRDLPPPGGPTVQLSSVTFTPASAFLSEAELGAIRARYVGRRVDFAGLSELVRDVNDLYAAKGVVTA